MKADTFAFTFALLGSLGAGRWVAAFGNGSLASDPTAWLLFVPLGMAAARSTAIYAAEHWYKSVILSPELAWSVLGRSRPFSDYRPQNHSAN
jgi:hypothetical protein